MLILFDTMLHFQVDSPQLQIIADEIVNRFIAKGKLWVQVEETTL